MISRRVALAVVGALACAACSQGGGIFARLPERATQAETEDDPDICGHTTPRFVMDRPDIGGEPTIDVEMERTDDACVWQVPKGVEAQRGVYSMLVRFDHALQRGTRCGDVGAKVIIGAYAKKAISFPFPTSFNGFEESQFRSTTDDTVPNYPDITFDVDDDGRDTLAEVKSGTDPCEQNAPPTITFAPETPIGALVDEGEGFWTITSQDQIDAPHDVVLTVRHRNAGAGTPVATLRLPTNGVPTVDPGADAHPTEGWVLEVVEGDTDTAVGAGAWRVRFRADEPFVGPIDIALESQIDGTKIGDGPAVTGQVEDVEDPTSLVVDENPALEFAEIVYREVNGTICDEDCVRIDALDQATTARVLPFDEDIDDEISGADVTVAENCGTALATEGFTDLVPDGAAYTFTWAPNNAIAVAAPVTGVPCEFTVDGEVFTLNLHVSPMKNDAPTIIAPDVSELQLPPPGFVTHTALFSVDDPDAVPTAPVCSIAMVATGTTPCDGNAVFNELRCESLAQVGSVWTYQITIEPNADYVTDCGTRPGFDATITITDTPPDENDAPVILDNADEPFAFRTVDIVVADTVAPGAGLNTQNGSSLPLIEPVRGVGLIEVNDAGSNSHLALVNLADGNAQIAFSIPTTFGDSFETDGLARSAVDSVNGRMLALVRKDGLLNMLLVELAEPLSASTFTNVDPEEATTCDEPFNDAEGKPVVDALGNFYMTCIGRAPSAPPARLVRIEPDGTRTAKTVAGARPPCSGCSDGDDFALVTSPSDGKEWVVFPEQDGITLVDLSTFDNATPSIVDIDVDATVAGWNGDDIWFSIVDEERGAYLFAHDTVLRRITFDTATPALEATALQLDSDISPGRLVLKRGPGGTPDEPDLITWPGSSSDSRTLIDLDTWTVVDDLDVLTWPSFATSIGLTTSPDPRYAFAPHNCVQIADPLYNVAGVWLWPWDQTDPFFIDFGLGCTGSGFEDVSLAGAYAVYQKDGDLIVVTFPAQLP